MTRFLSRRRDGRKFIVSQVPIQSYVCGECSVRRMGLPYDVVDNVPLCRGCFDSHPEYQSAPLSDTSDDTSEKEDKKEGERGFFRQDRIEMVK